MIGEVFGNFRIVSRVGRGGMGEVYLAEQQNIGTRVAVKLLLPEISADAEHVQRFFNEARAVSRIQHAGIVKMFDVGFHASGHAYLVMEFLEGESLASRIRRTTRLTPAHIADLGRQIASVLDATHSAGITHRDLKPDNIFIVPDRELASRQRIKILDFGIAKLSGTLAHASPRTIGTMGTPAYMAPEQWGDASKVDWRADIYSLGCLVFEMACGRPPFIVTTLAEACGKHLTEIPPEASTFVPDLPPELVELIACMLEKRPDDRPQSMDVVVKRFEAIAAIVGPPPPMVLAAPNVHPSHPASPSGRGGGAGPALGATVATEYPARDPGLAATVGTELPAPRATGTSPRMPERPAVKRSKVPIAIAALVLLGAGGGAAAYFLRDRAPAAPEVPAPIAVPQPVPPPAEPRVEGPFECDAGLAWPQLVGSGTQRVPLRYRVDPLKKSEILSTYHQTWKVEDPAGIKTGDLTMTLTMRMSLGSKISDTIYGHLTITRISVDDEISVQPPGKDAEVRTILWRSEEPDAPAELDSLRSLIDYPITFSMSDRGQITADSMQGLKTHMKAKRVPPNIQELFTRAELFRTLIVELPEQHATLDTMWRGGELLRKLPSRGEIMAPYELRVAAMSADGKQVVIESRPELRLALSGRIKELTPRRTAFQMWTMFDVDRGELSGTQARACARMWIELDGKPMYADAVLHTTMTSRPLALTDPGRGQGASPTPKPAPTIKEVSAKMIPALKRCHAARVLEHPPARSIRRANITVTLTDTGAVDRVTVQGTDDEIKACIRGVVMAAKFPAGVAQNVPIVVLFERDAAEVGDTSEPATGTTPAVGPADESAMMRRLIKETTVAVSLCGVHAPDVRSVSVRVQVGPDGKIASVAAAALAQVKLCVEASIRNLEFPPSTNGAVLVHGYLLRSPQQSTRKPGD